MTDNERAAEKTTQFLAALTELSRASRGLVSRLALQDKPRLFSFLRTTSAMISAEHIDLMKKADFCSTERSMAI